MKLSKQAERQIRESIAQLQTGIDFIMESKTVIVRQTNCAQMPEDDWQNKTGKKGGSICKEIGSNLTGIYNAKRTLENMLLKPEVFEDEALVALRGGF